MNKVYEEFFYVPKHGKVREKVMLTRIAVSIVLILICMAAMSISAYAYFTCNIASGISTIQAAQYDLAVTTDVPVENGIYTLDNSTGDASKVFTLTLTRVQGENMAAVGFGEVLIDGKPFYTKPIGVQVIDSAAGSTAEVNTCTVDIIVPAKKSVSMVVVDQLGTPTDALDGTLLSDSAYAWKVVITEEMISAISTNNAAVMDDSAADSSGDSQSGHSTDSAATPASSAVSSADSGSSDTQDSGSFDTQDSGTPMDTAVTDNSAETDSETSTDIGTPIQSSNASDTEANTTDTAAAADASNDSVNSDTTDTTDTTESSAS